MDYGIIGKVEKAKRYAEQIDRVRFDEFAVTIDGDNNPHQVSYSQGNWSCDCHFFATRGFCSHTMAMERILGAMLPQPANGTLAIA
jgi:hypothetical protein